MIERAPKLLHPKCSPPGWWERRRLKVRVHDVWICPVCGIRYEWSLGERGGTFWQLQFREAWKSLLVHDGLNIPVRPDEAKEAARLKACFWADRTD